MSLLMDAPPSLGVLEALEALPFADLSASDAGVALRTAALARGRLDVVEALLLGIFNRGNGARADGATDTAAWLAAKTKTSGRDASRSVKRAKVIEALPELGDALSAGEISAAHVDEIAGIVPAKLLPKAAKLVRDAKSSTPEELAHKAHQLVIDNDGDGGGDRVARLKARQAVRFFDLESGMRAMFGEWAPETTAAIERAVDQVAGELWRAEHPNRNPTPHEEATLKYRRAQAVSEIARRVLARAEAEAAAEAAAETDKSAAGTSAHDASTNDEAGAAEDDASAADAVNTDDGHTEVADEVVKAPITSKRVTAKASKQGPSLALAVLIDFQTLTGALAAKGICELFDGTPISPDTVRRLACDAALIPMVLGSRGEVLNQGRRIYLPTVAQRHAVAVRDRHCAFPGCRRPAKWTDVHHIVAFKPGAATGGTTDLDNLLLLCDKHHHMVHEAQWKLVGTALDFDVFRPDGTLFDHVTRGPP